MKQLIEDLLAIEPSIQASEYSETHYGLIYQDIAIGVEEVEDSEDYILLGCQIHIENELTKKQMIKGLKLNHYLDEMSCCFALGNDGFPVVQCLAEIKTVTVVDFIKLLKLFTNVVEYVFEMLELKPMEEVKEHLEISPDMAFTLKG